MLSLNSKISELNRVGTTTAQYLKKLGLVTIEDLLFYLPYRYDDFSHALPIADLKEGETANVLGTIELIQNKKSWRQRKYLTEALVSDESETLKVIWFNQPFLTRNLKVGDKISLAGRVSDNYGQLVMISPQYEKIYSEDLIHTKGLVPNYHLSAGVTQKQLRFLIKQIIGLAKNVPDWLPPAIKNKLKLLNLATALTQIHFPKNSVEVIAAQQRLSFADLFLRQIRAQMIKRQLKTRRAPMIAFKEAATKKFVASLPFKLTDAQRKSAWEILKDLEKNEPMSRLLEGDVGSGKTLVATLALFNVALNQAQGALMVPTEILAQQHFKSLTQLLNDFNFKIGLLTNGQKKTNYELESENLSGSAKLKTEAIVQEILTESDIIIGTQALIQAKIKFSNLALIVVDEQHRFGVSQRKKLLDLGPTGLTPHFLSLTATPIPRSLALAIYGDLDLSIINQLPLGRKPVITKIVLEPKRSLAYEFIKKQIKVGRQVFVICPLIDESDKLGVKSVKTEFEHLDKEVFPETKMGLLHGRVLACHNSISSAVGSVAVLSNHIVFYFRLKKILIIPKL
ncbi:MAG: ATP-dependent DNA helicase RecG [Candidatus Falkowbacteria bacterium]|nr:ATP-dependent DNA helicase RecG [Candidatus Falkowbacteria bacterium]